MRTLLKYQIIFVSDINAWNLLEKKNSVELVFYFCKSSLMAEIEYNMSLFSLPFSPYSRKSKIYINQQKKKKGKTPTTNECTLILKNHEQNDRQTPIVNLWNM